MACPPTPHPRLTVCHPWVLMGTLTHRTVLRDNIQRTPLRRRMGSIRRSLTSTHIPSITSSSSSHTHPGTLSRLSTNNSSNNTLHYNKPPARK